MTTQEQLQFIREKCILSNKDGFEFGVEREIRLADVLLAIPLYAKELMKPDFSANAIYVKGNEIWYLKNDSLSDQSPETIEFIYNLLK